MKKAYDVVMHVPSLKGGGAERVAIEVARHFSEQGKSTVFFLYEGELAYDLPPGVDVVVARCKGHLRRVAAFRAFLKEVEIRSVVSFLPYANLISLLANAFLSRPPRLVVSEHLSYAEFGPVKIKDRIKFGLLSRLYQRSDCIVAVSKGVADDLRQRLRGSAASKITVIHNPCYIPDANATCASRDDSINTVLAVGRLTHQKGFDVLIKAFASVRRQITSARLIIIGEGPDRADLEALVARYGLTGSISMPGFTRKIADEYRRADLFVCSSRAEGFGNVIVEALSFGLPVVSTACKHGPDEILEGGRYGTLVPVGDDAALSTAIVSALGKTVDHEAQIARARDFALVAVGSQYMKVAGFIA